MFGEPKTVAKNIPPPPRKRIESLVQVTQDFPEKLPKKIASITKRVTPFEDMALAAGKDQIAGLDLNDLMEAEGVLNEDLVREIESGGRMMRAYWRTQEALLLRPRHEEFEGGGRFILDEAVVQKWERFGKRVDANMNGIIARLDADRRPIALNFTSEMMQYSLLISLAQQAQSNGLDAAADVHRKRTELPVHQQILIQSVIAAAKYQAVGEAPIREYSAKDAFELLRDGAYEATEDWGVPIDLPGVQCSGKAMKATLQTFSTQNPLILGCIELHSPVTGGVLARFVLSRITGELVPDGMQLVSGREIFAIMGNPGAYDRIRDAAFCGLLQAVEEGKIKEMPFVSLTKDEQTQVAFRPPKARLKAPPVPPVGADSDVVLKEEESGISQNIDQISVDSLDLQAVQPKIRELSIAEQIAEMNRTNTQEKRDRVVWLESRITWRRVIRALKRIGVTIEMGGAHPKLKFQSKTTRYLNSHEGDSARNKHELYRVLDELFIPKDAFFAALK